MAMSEAIMEHIGAYLAKDPLDVRLANMDPSANATTIFYINRARQWSDFDNRHKQAEAFNQVQNDIRLDSSDCRYFRRTVG